MPRSSLVLLVLACSGALSAQAPVITPAGDPSVNADTIYRLAVDPKAFPEETSRFLLDDGVLRLEADGRGTRTYRQIVQILRPEAEEGYHEMKFSYAPKHERFTLNWIRVVKPDGSVVSEKPTQMQESDVPAQMGDPIYSDRKVIRVSISGVAAGTIVDYSYTSEELQPFLTGDSFHSWGVSTGLAVERSRYIVDLPANVKPTLHERNLSFKRQETVANGRRTMVWATKNLPKLKAEAFAADSNDVYMSVAFALPETWGTIGKWYAGNAKDRYALTPDVEAKLSSLVSGARTLGDSIRAVHRWVAQDVRYVSIALGLGGYQPRPPAEVLSTVYGDCKDKATIFVAMMRRMGLTAHPVLLSASGGVVRELPSINQFDHAIAAYKLPGDAKYRFVDLTASLTPLGELPFSLQGEFGIVVLPDGKVEEVTFPLTPVSANRTEMRLVGAITDEGLFEGSYEELTFGNQQGSVRDGFSNPMDSTQRAAFANRLATQWFQGAEGTDAVATPGKDLTIPPRVSVRISGGRAAQVAGATVILQNPLGTMANLVAAAKELDAQPPRIFPIDPQKIFGYQETVIEVRMTLPEGWRAELPPSVEAIGPFGAYVTEYKQDGRVFQITRRISGGTEVQGKDQMPALTAWMRQIGKDDARVIVIAKLRP